MSNKSRRLLTLFLVVISLFFGACSSTPPSRYAAKNDSAPVERIDLSTVADAKPREEPKSRWGNAASYEVRGKRYYTKKSSKGYVERGIASWYGTKFHGHRTSSGEPYDMYSMSAAHKTLPLPTYAKITNLKNGKTVIVKINDRGPFHENRLIDLSYAAATRLNILGTGTGLVEIRTIDPSIPTRSANMLRSRPKIDPRTMPKTPGLFLQVGAFANHANAVRLKTRIQQSLPGKQLHIKSIVSDARPVFRVRIGPLASVELADKLTASLIAKGLPAARVVID